MNNNIQGRVSSLGDVTAAPEPTGLGYAGDYAQETRGEERDPNPPRGFGDNLAYDSVDGGSEVVMDRGEEEMLVDAGNSGLNHIRKFSVEQLEYGYLVKVGCHTFALERHTTVTRMIGEYLANPQETESKWFANELALKRNHTV